jgi:hypothetical protein
MIAVYGGVHLVTRLQRSGVASHALREGKRKRIYAVFGFKQTLKIISAKIKKAARGEKQLLF